MNNNIVNKQFIAGVIILLSLAGTSILSSCNETHMQMSPPVTSKFEHDENPDEIILFCGNPGSGKSSLCNSIFNELIFQSGTTVGGGMTREKQEYIYQNKKYIDTPGLSDITRRKEAAVEIEKSLKEDKDYKIIFVVTLQAGRIRPDDLTTINIVCDSIKADFQYGIIFNKVTNPVINKVGENGEKLEPYLALLKQQPSKTIIIKKEEDMEDAQNVYLALDSTQRTRLINFINDLGKSKVPSDVVQKLDITDYKKMLEEMESNFNTTIKDTISTGMAIAITTIPVVVDSMYILSQDQGLAKKIVKGVVTETVKAAVSTGKNLLEEELKKNKK